MTRAGDLPPAGTVPGVLAALPAQTTDSLANRAPHRCEAASGTPQQNLIALPNGRARTVADASFQSGYACPRAASCHQYTVDSINASRGRLSSDPRSTAREQEIQQGATPRRRGRQVGGPVLIPLLPPPSPRASLGGVLHPGAACDTPIFSRAVGAYSCTVARRSPPALRKPRRTGTPV